MHGRLPPHRRIHILQRTIPDPRKTIRRRNLLKTKTDHRKTGKTKRRQKRNPTPPDNTPDDNRSEPDRSEPDRPESDQSAPMPRDTEDRMFEIGATFKVKHISAAKDRIFRRGSGRRSRTRVSQKQGRYVKSCMNPKHGDIALDATLRAAAPYQKSRKRTNGLCVTLTAQDIRGKIREKRIGNFLFFVVDASGSMGARGRMAASKGAVMSLLLDAYRKRDRVAMISFRRNEAVVNLPPTTSVDLAGKLLAELTVGGRTPLSAGLVKTHEQVRNVLLKDPAAGPIVILITDGKSNAALGNGKPLDEALQLAEMISRDERIRFVVVDTEEAGLIAFGLAQRLAAAFEGPILQNRRPRGANPCGYHKRTAIVKKTPIYPFTAIVGQEKMKLALILNVINPGLSGVLIRGEKGTAKSTAVRALADILPVIEVFADDPFQLAPE